MAAPRWCCRARRPAHRRDLVRQGRHVRPDVRLPAVPGQPLDLSWADTAGVLAWIAGIPGLVLSLYAAVLYVPLARRASGRAPEAVGRRESHGPAAAWAVPPGRCGAAW